MKLIKRIFNLADDVLAYLLTLICILFMNTIPMLSGNDSIKIDFSIVRIIASALVALLLTLWQESIRPDETGSKIKSKEGRRKRFIQRMLNAMIFGFGASKMMDIIFSKVIGV